MFQELTLRARFLARTLGHRSAAGYLRNRGVSLEVALTMLFPTRYSAQQSGGAL